jgi:hypothetical protein
MYARWVWRWSLSMMFHVVLTKDEEGWIVAECPALPAAFRREKRNRKR